MPTADAMTEVQSRCWRALRAYHRQFGTAPTFAVLGDMLGVTRQRAHALCREMERAGLLGRDAHGRLVPHDLTGGGGADVGDQLTAERWAELRRIARRIPDPAMAHSDHWLSTDLATTWHSLPALLDAADERDRLRAELAAVVRKADHGCYGHPCDGAGDGAAGGR